MILHYRSSSVCLRKTLVFLTWSNLTKAYSLTIFNTNCSMCPKPGAWENDKLLNLHLSEYLSVVTFWQLSDPWVTNVSLPRWPGDQWTLDNVVITITQVMDITLLQQVHHHHHINPTPGFKIHLVLSSAARSFPFIYLFFMKISPLQWKLMFCQPNKQSLHKTSQLHRTSLQLEVMLVTFHSYCVLLLYVLWQYNAAWLSLHLTLAYLSQWLDP